MTHALVRSLDRERWSEFVSHQPRANIFHTPEMFEVFSRARGHRPHLFAAVDGDAILALLTAVDVTLVGGALAPLTTRAIAYGGVAVDERRSGEALEGLLRDYVDRTRVPLYSELRNIDDTTTLRPRIERSGFEYEPHLNYLVRLDRPSDEVLQAIGRRTRRRIAKGMRTGRVVIAEVDNREQLKAWYRLVKATYRYAGVPLAHPSLFLAAFDVLKPKGMIKFLLASVGDVYAACSAELLHKDRIFAWYAGTDRAFSAYVPSELLMWWILEWGAANRYRLYDFGGAGTPDEPYGVRDFKAKFGGDLVEYGRYVAVHGRRRLAVSAFAYSILREARLRVRR